MSYLPCLEIPEIQNELVCISYFKTKRVELASVTASRTFTRLNCLLVGVVLYFNSVSRLQPYTYRSLISGFMTLFSIPVAEAVTPISPSNNMESFDSKNQSGLSNEASR